jgi:hypothetical protein
VRRPRTAPVLAVLLALLAPIGAACSSGDTATTSTSSTASTTTAATGPPAGATEEGLRSVAIGQCFELPRDDPEAQDRAVWIIDCADPHTHEVFDIVDFAGPELKGGGYAGAAAVQDWAEQACFDRFEAFVGVPWTRSNLEIETWWPSAESWGRNDRKVICTVFPQSGGRTTGSQRGTGR